MQVNFRQGQDVKQGDLLFTIDPRPFEAALRQAQANLAKDRAMAHQADADEKRYALLLKQEVGSRQQYDQIEANAASLAATVQADEAAVQTAKLNLAYTEIRAPITGRTGDLLVHAGALVKPDADTAMVVINQVHPVYVDFAVPEHKLQEVGESLDNQTVVTSGLKAGETVVTDGQLKLIPGAKVTIKSGLSADSGITS